MQQIRCQDGINQPQIKKLHGAQKLGKECQNSTVKALNLLQRRTTIGWEKFSVSDVDLTPKPITPGVYELQLLGAYENKYNTGTTDVVFAITGDSPEAGKRVRMEIPDVEEQPWAGDAYARLIQALGAEVEPYTHPKEALTLVAQNSHGKVQGRVYTETFERKDGSAGFRDKIAMRSIRPSA